MYLRSLQWITSFSKLIPDVETFFSNKITFPSVKARKNKI